MAGMAKLCRAHSHVSGNFQKLRYFFFILVLRQHVNGVFGHQKCRFLKTVNRVKIFKNAGLSLLKR